jgi:hypothetical protein
MVIKKLYKIVPLALLLAITVPASSAIIGKDPVPISSEKTEDPRAQQLMSRLETIRDMNKEGLTGSEKKGLRKEVKGIRKEMRTIKGGVYLSVGAIIIVVLLLIILL